MYADARFGRSSGVLLEATADVITNRAVVTCSPGTGVRWLHFRRRGTTAIQDDTLAFTLYYGNALSLLVRRMPAKQ
jgi:hypothetical protein